MSTRRFLITGNPENRRVQGFVAALESRGQPKPIVVSHLAALEGALEEIAEERLIVRLDAAGENTELTVELLRRGFDAALAEGAPVRSPETLASRPPAQGEIVCPRQYHLGFSSYLGDLQGLLDRRPGWLPLSAIDDVVELFDKRITSEKYRQLGVSVPESLPPIAGADGLRQAMDAAGWPTVFVKLASGSSASCLAVYSWSAGRGRLMTTIRRQNNGWFNSLRVQRLDEPQDIDEVLSFLLGEGSQIERAVPKARLEGAFFDCRVLMVAGQPAFCVVRQSRHPITNLHLGGWRGEMEALQTAVPEASWSAALDSCRQVAAAHDCLHLGIDVMFEPGFERHRILEANAFGDLLPGLERDGLDVYEWQIEQLGSWLRSRRAATRAVEDAQTGLPASR